MNTSYPVREGKLTTRSLEYSVAYHCNLRCRHCSHLSPFVEKHFPSAESFRADLAALSGALHAETLRLLGGEPLLNPHVSAFLREAKESRIADRVMVTTNGLLLDRVNDAFWSAVDLVLVTGYPGFDVESAMRRAAPRARAAGAELWLCRMTDFRATVVTRPHPHDWITSAIFATCNDAHLYQCHMVHEGYLYKCAVPPFLPGYLQKCGHDGYDPHADGLAIHGTSDLAGRLSRFLHSTRPPAACGYCLGSVGRAYRHRQLTGLQVAQPWRLDITCEKDMDETRLAASLLALAAAPTGRSRASALDSAPYPVRWDSRC
jgi:MoaA/NifB/PqqE/SkfB family radical SAM enzyme